MPNAVYVSRNVLSMEECQAWIDYAEGRRSWDVVSHPATRHVAHRECSRLQTNDSIMSHRLYRRIEDVIDRISPLLNVVDEYDALSNMVRRRDHHRRRDDHANASGDIDAGVGRGYRHITCNPNLRLYKYIKGQWFGRHVDESNDIVLSPSTDAPSSPHVVDASRGGRMRTEMTVLFYLSSCRGGETRFHLPRGGGGGHGGGGGGSSVAFAPEAGAVLLHVHGDRCLEHEAEPVSEGVKYGKRGVGGGQ